MPLTFDDNNDTVLIDLSGSEVSTRNGQTVVSKSMFIVGGSDGTTARFLKLTSDGTTIVTGSISTNVVNESVGGNNQNIPISSTLAAGSDGTLLRPLKVNTNGNLLVTSSIENFPVTQSIKIVDVGTNITQSITGSVTINNPVTTLTAIQGSSGSQFWKVTGSVDITNFPVTQSIRLVAVGTNITQSITGSVQVNRLTFVSGNNLSVFISSSNILPVTGTITVNNPITNLTANQGNSGSQFWKITGSVDITNYPITQSVRLVAVGTDVTQSITGSVTSVSHQGVSGALPWKTELRISGDAISSTNRVPISGSVQLNRSDNKIGAVSLTDVSGSKNVEVVFDPTDGFNRVAVAAKVVIVTPMPPSSSTSVTIDASTPLSVATTHTTSYTITSNKIFHMQQITLGAEGDPNERGSKLEIFYVSGATSYLFERIYIASFSTQFTYSDVKTTRNGTIMSGTAGAQIQVVRERLGGSALEIDAVVRGFEQ